MPADTGSVGEALHRITLADAGSVGHETEPIAMNFMTKLKLTLALIGILLIAIIVFQNTYTVDANFLFVSYTMPLAVMLGLVFAMGLIVGLLVAYSFGRKKSAK
jgi:uncharacterized integral membrane protein